jgi:hypothetical protein
MNMNMSMDVNMDMGTGTEMETDMAINIPEIRIDWISNYSNIELVQNKN